MTKEDLLNRAKLFDAIYKLIRQYRQRSKLMGIDSDSIEQGACNVVELIYAPLEQNGWIKFQDQCPPDSEIVLCWAGDEIFCATFDMDDMSFINESGLITDVYYWRNILSFPHELKKTWSDS